MNKETIIQVGITVGMIILLTCIIILTLNQMEEHINQECAKINYNGIAEFLEFDVDCAQFSNLSNITTVEVGMS